MSGFGISFDSNDKKKKSRPYVNRKDVLKLHGSLCKICGKSNKDVPLMMAHYKAHSKGGNLVFPLCPNCHTNYDRGLLTSAELKKIGLNKEEYARYRPKKPNKASKKDKNPFGIDYDYFKIPKTRKGKGLL